MLSRFYVASLPIPFLKKGFISINKKQNHFNGNGGCNTISGGLLVSEENIKFQQITSTRMGCLNLQQEHKFIKALKEITRFKIIGKELFLYKEDLKILVLEKMEVN